MERAEAVQILQDLATSGWLSPRAVEAIGVVLASPPAAAPAPVAPQAAPSPAPATAPAAASTGTVGFIGLLTIPDTFWMSDIGEDWVPHERQHSVLAWSRLLSFGGPGRLPPDAGETWLQRFVRAVLPGQWRVEPVAASAEAIILRRDRNTSLQIPRVGGLFQEVHLGGEARWELRNGASTYTVLSIIAHAASATDIGPETMAALSGGDLVEVPGVVFGPALPLTVTITGIDGYIAWTTTLAERIRHISGRRLMRRDPTTPWDELSGDEQEMWTFWVRNHPGMIRLELALRDFFSAGGARARVGLSLSADGEPDGVIDASGLGAVCAPGLSGRWQSALTAWAAAQGITAVTESPRYADHAAPARIFLDDDGWTLTAPGFEGSAGVCAPDASSGDWRVVENPLTLGPHDTHRFAPPSGWRAAGQA